MNSRKHSFSGETRDCKQTFRHVNRTLCNMIRTSSSTSQDLIVTITPEDLVDKNLVAFSIRAGSTKQGSSEKERTSKCHWRGVGESSQDASCGAVGQGVLRPLHLIKASERTTNLRYKRLVMFEEILFGEVLRGGACFATISINQAKDIQKGYRTCL